MPGLKSSIPKFGNWDRNEDISYSTVFDKARAEKEALFQTLDEEYEKALSTRSLSPKRDGRTRNKTSKSLPPVSAEGRKDKEFFLQTSKENGRSSISHQGRRSKQTSEKGRSRVKSYESTVPGFSSRQSAVLRDHQNVGSEQCLHNLRACPHNVLGVCAHNPIVSGVPSRESGGTTERQHPYQDDQSLEERQYKKSFGSGRHLYEGELTDTKSRNPSEKNIEMQRGSTVPKFGDWLNGDGYTKVFDDMSKERNSKRASRRSIVRNGQVQMDQDLYNGSKQMKHQRSWLAIMCCTKP